MSESFSIMKQKRIWNKENRENLPQDILDYINEIYINIFISVYQYVYIILTFLIQFHQIFHKIILKIK